MQRALAVIRLHRGYSGACNEGACGWQCPFVREGPLLYCGYHDRFIDAQKHEQMKKCSLDSCEFMRPVDNGARICVVSGRLLDYDVSGEGSYKYQWCSGADNQAIGNGYDKKIQREEEKDAKRKSECTGKQSIKRPKPVSYKDEMSGKQGDLLRRVRESMLRKVHELLDSITIGVSEERKSVMANAACHAYSIFRLKRPEVAHRIALRTFAALFFRICLDDQLPVRGSIKVPGVSFPFNFTKICDWAAKVGEAGTRAISRKQLMLRDVIKECPEIVQIENYNPFIIPPQAQSWEDLQF